MEKERVILGENCCYSSDCNETGLNNNIRLDKELGLLNAQNNDELVPVEPIEEEIKYKTMIQDNRAIA